MPKQERRHNLHWNNQLEPDQKTLKPNLTTLMLLIGFDGKKCEKLTTLSFNNEDSYIRVPTLNTSPGANVTVTFATKQSQGEKFVSTIWI